MHETKKSREFDWRPASAESGAGDQIRWVGCPERALPRSQAEPVSIKAMASTEAAVGARTGTNISGSA
jgi:hypothetical protein